MKLLLVKSLFCPNAIYLQQNFNALTKLDCFFKLLNSNSIKIDLYLIGWANIYAQEIDIYLKLIKFNFNRIIKQYLPINFGKYYFFNIVKESEHICDYEYIMYMDHDIYLEFNNFDTFQEIFALFDHKINNKYIGLIVFNQKEDCRHQKDIYENKTNVNNINICWPNIHGSIACGCFISKTNIFSCLDSFELLSVYGFDDMYLTKQFEKKNYITVVLEQIYVIHPLYVNKIYDKWKSDVIINLINGKKYDYYRMIEESMNMWQNNNLLYKT